MSRIDYSVVNPDNKWIMLKSQWLFAVWALWISSGVVMLGFDTVAGNQLAALPVFQKQFGILQADGSYLVPARYLSAWNAIAPACEIATTFLFTPVLEKYGRKPGILAASVISVSGILLQQLATNWKVHLAGRAVNGIAIGMMFTISPLWIGETCRPELRGFFLCFFNTSIVFGQLAIVAISRGSSYIDGQWQWWCPVAAMYMFPVILITIWPIFPESPYWLVRQGRSAQARASLRRVYGIKDEAFYDIELDRMAEEHRVTAAAVETVKASQHETFLGLNISTGLECFRGQNRKRTLTAILVTSSQQMLGATFVIGYATYFLELIGISDYFDASVTLYGVMLLASMTAFPLVETLGRRTLLVWPQFALCLILFMIGLLGCIPEQERATWGIVVFIYLWAIVYQVSVGATGFVLASEIASPRVRGSTQGLVTICNASWGLVMQFTIPYMINPDSGHLGGKVGFIFLVPGLLAATGGYFLYPETQGLSFDLLDELYSQNANPRHFKSKAREIVAASVKGQDAGMKTNGC